jgi:hypothetical protein
MGTWNGVERDLIIRTTHGSGPPGRDVKTILTTL